jgi:septum formation protein
MGSAQVKAGFGRKLLFLEGDSYRTPRTVPRLILASTSLYRRALLERLGVDFEAVSPGVSETHRPGESAHDRALRLAIEKARAVAGRHPDDLVIGSDQVAAGPEGVLDKPGDEPRCRAQLASLSGRSAQFHTACAVVDGVTRRTETHVDLTTCVFRTLTLDEIERYVERERPFDCAGGFKAEALGIGLFESIDSRDPTALIGLPLIWLAGALRAAGVPVP